LPGFSASISSQEDSQTEQNRRQTSYD
jgi:hypothetical protein